MVQVDRSNMHISAVDFFEKLKAKWKCASHNGNACYTKSADGNPELEVIHRKLNHTDLVSWSVEIVSLSSIYTSSIQSSLLQRNGKSTLDDPPAALLLLPEFMDNEVDAGTNRNASSPPINVDSFRRGSRNTSPLAAPNPSSLNNANLETTTQRFVSDNQTGNRDSSIPVQRLEISLVGLNTGYSQAQNIVQTRSNTKISIRRLFEMLDDDEAAHAVDPRSPGPTPSVFKGFLPIFHKYGIRSTRELSSVKHDLINGGHKRPAQGLIEELKGIADADDPVPLYTEMTMILQKIDEL